MFLAACGVPTGISVAGYVADGLSAGASGKTVNDHLISQIMNMDCGLMRFLSGDWICRPRGTNPDDDTIYMADGRTMEGPPRPWGTNAEPELQYDDDSEHDARNWAQGVELAAVSIGDDPSGEMITADYDTDEGAVDTVRVGDMATARKREERYQAVAERIRFAQALQMQYQQAEAGFVMPQSVRYQPADVALQARPSSMIILDNLAFSEALNLDMGYRSTSPTMVAALSDLPQSSTKVAAAPVVERKQVAWSSAGSANSLDPTAYGSATETIVREVSVADAAPRPSAPTDKPTAVAEVAPPSTLPRLRDRKWRLAAADTYLVVGSFMERSNAVTAAALRQSADVAVVESAVKGRTFYRLVAGPFETARLDSARRRLSAAGYADSWSISLCALSATDAQGCLSESQVAALRETDNDPPVLQVAGLAR